MGLRICSRMRVLFVRKPLLNWFPRPEKSSSNQRARFWTFEGNSTDGDFFSKHVELIHLADLGFSKKTLLSYFFHIYLSSFSLSSSLFFFILSLLLSCFFSLLSSPLFSALLCSCVLFVCRLFVCCCLCVVVCIRAHAEKTCARVDGIHGDVLNMQTEAFCTYTGGGVIAFSVYQKITHVDVPLPRGSPKKTEES